MTQSMGAYVSTRSVDMSSLADAEITTLQKVLNPAILGKELTILPERSVTWSTVHDTTFRPLKWHKGKRCTLEISFRTDNGPCQLIAKVYAKDRGDVYETMDVLRCGKFHESAQFSIPRPLAYVPSLRLHLEEKLAGRNAKEVFLTGTATEQTDAAERSARWLAHFHEWAPRSGAFSAPESGLARMERWARKFRELGGTISASAQLLFERLAAAFPQLGPAELCAGHGSFSPDHVFFVGERVMTIDWDGFDAGDPARDVARFAVTMQRLALGRIGSINALDLPARAFLDTYIRIRGSAISPHLPYYMAATCLKFAKYGALSHRVSGWEDKVGAMLLEGLRVLEA